MSRVVGPPEVETKDDIKFIWNGRVLSTTEEVQEVCMRYFGEMEKASGTVVGKGDDAIPTTNTAPANNVLILHAVVRPPIAPTNRRGKVGVDGAGSSGGRDQGTGDGWCSCCTVS